MNIKILTGILSIFIFLASPHLLRAQSTSEIIAGVSEEKLEHFEAFIQREIAEGNIPGAVTMIMRDGELVYEGSFGYSNLSDKSPMETNQLFYIQSMTKPIMTVAFMMLYEEGHFLLTDPVSKYIPAFKDLVVSKDVNKGATGETESMHKEITIAHLLSHTAGFSHGLGASTLDADYREEMYGGTHTDITSRVNGMLKLPLIGQPGGQWYYSAAPDVLSVLIEKFSGMSTDQFLGERIFAPLGMENTGYNIPDAESYQLCQLHYKNSDDQLTVSPRQQKLTENTIWSGVNGLFSTAGDYLTFCQFMLNNGEWNGQNLLGRKTIELMTKDHVGDLYTSPGTGFGLGFAVVTDVAKCELLGSEGMYYWSGAFNTHFFIDPKENMAAVFMTQTAPYNSYYHNKLRQMVLQAVVD